MISLESLVERAQAGDTSAFSLIVEKLQDLAVGYAVSLVGDLMLAEEIAQEAFLRTFLDLDSLREPKAFRSWFRRIVQVRSSRWTRRKRLSTVSLESAAELESPNPSSDDVVDSHELRVAVTEAIQALPEREATAITLHYISDYSYREIASFLDVPVSTVKSRLYTARGRLRERLREEVKRDLRESWPSRSKAFIRRVAEVIRRATLADPDSNLFTLAERRYCA